MTIAKQKIENGFLLDLYSIYNFVGAFVIVKSTIAVHGIERVNSTIQYLVNLFRQNAD